MKLNILYKMKTDLTNEILNIIEKEVALDSQDYIAKQLDELFASQLNPERVREVLSELIKLFDENILVRNTDNDDDFARFTKEGLRITNVLKELQSISDLCSGSQEKEQPKQIKLGEVFEVDGKKYAIQKPDTSSKETDPHGTITYYLIEL